jgi:hypothetical protein
MWKLDAMKAFSAATLKVEADMMKMQISAKLFPAKA